MVNGTGPNDAAVDLALVAISTHHSATNNNSCPNDADNFAVAKK
jgi:hypothetical protein